MRKLGHDAFGIDVSEEAIEFAKNTFGDYYGLKAEGKYDVIVSIETIEHVEDPVGFIKQYVGMLNPNGALILTTPNLEFYFKIFWDLLQKFAQSMETINLKERLHIVETLYKDYMWVTDPPPIHLSLFTHFSFERIAQQNSMHVKFIDLHKQKGEVAPIVGAIITV